MRNSPCGITVPFRANATINKFRILSDFLVPNQVNCTRQAAIVARRRSPGVALSVLVRPLVDRLSMRSSKVLIEPPEKEKGGPWVRLINRDFLSFAGRTSSSAVRLSQQSSERLATFRGQIVEQRLDLVESMTTQGSYACLGCRCNHQLAGLVLAGQDGRFHRVRA